jgi:ketosteroid isomerase-like protein
MPRDKVDVAKRAVDAYNRGDVDGFFAELATPDYEFSLPPQDPRWGGKPLGREGVERFFADASEDVEEAQNVAEEFRDLGDRMLVLGRLKGLGKGSGAPFDQAYAGIFEFRGDRIWRYRRFLDRAEGLRAAGLSE